MKTSRVLTAAAVAAVLQIGVASAQTPSPTDPPAHPAMPDSKNQTATPSPSDQPTHPATEGAKQGASFASLDTDGDGRISKSEAEADAKVKQQFSMYDKNGNGFIEKSEVMTANESSPPEAPKQ